MRIIDKIVEYFFERKIKVKNNKEIKKIENNYYLAAIYSKVPFMKKYCVWSMYCKDIKTATDANTLISNITSFDSNTLI